MPPLAPAEKERLPAVIGARLPPLTADTDEKTQERFLEFFGAQIRNKNTRGAYGRAVGQFLQWAEQQGLTLRAITPIGIM